MAINNSDLTADFVSNYVEKLGAIDAIYPDTTSLEGKIILKLARSLNEQYKINNDRIALSGGRASGRFSSLIQKLQHAKRSGYAVISLETWKEASKAVDELKQYKDQESRREIDYHDLFKLFLDFLMVSFSCVNFEEKYKQCVNMSDKEARRGHIKCQECLCNFITGPGMPALIKKLQESEKS